MSFVDPSNDDTTYRAELWYYDYRGLYVKSPTNVLKVTVEKYGMSQSFLLDEDTLDKFKALLTKEKRKYNKDLMEPCT